MQPALTDYPPAYARVTRSFDADENIGGLFHCNMSDFAEATICSDRDWPVHLQLTPSPYEVCMYICMYEHFSLAIFSSSTSPNSRGSSSSEMIRVFGDEVERRIPSRASGKSDIIHKRRVVVRIVCWE